VISQEIRMRVPRLAVEQMTPRQQEVHDKIIGRRGQANGPYPVWLHSPELCERAEALSAYLRFECSLPLKLREFSILITARFWDAQYPWIAHAEKAVAEGIDRSIVDALAEKQVPVFSDAGERVFYEFTMELLREHYVSNETYAAAQQIFGDRGVIDIVACVGNFSTLAMTLNAFLVDLRGPPPFADIGEAPYVSEK